MATKLLPALHSTSFQFVLIANDLVMPTGVAFPERQGESPVAFLADHPIVHVAQPVQLTVETEGRNPADLARHVHDSMPQFVHADEPLIHQPKDEFHAAAPTGRVAVFVGLNVVQESFVSQGFEDRLQGPRRHACRSASRSQRQSSPLHSAVRGSATGVPCSAENLRHHSPAQYGQCPCLLSRSPPPRRGHGVPQLALASPSPRCSRKV